MNQTNACPHCGRPNPEDFSFCAECGRFIKSSDRLRVLTLALCVLTALSGLVWGAALYAELVH